MPKPANKGEQLPNLPVLLKRKIYKTGQTRGADDDEIFQNRVARNSTVLIPYGSWSSPFPLPDREDSFERGFIVLLTLKQYLALDDPTSCLAEQGLSIGTNALVFYSSRAEWNAYPPDSLSWSPAQTRTPPLGGQYVARVPGTTAMEGGQQIRRGFTSSSTKGGGIRVFEYAPAQIIEQCRDQLEALFWLCEHAVPAVVRNGMGQGEALTRRCAILDRCREQGLLDQIRLMKVRVLDREGITVCPLCLERIAPDGFFSRMQQAAGREVEDLTVTEISLFHIDELRVRKYNHRPYNVGWGHHHCNVVVRDRGVADTLRWMAAVLRKNKEAGLLGFGE